MSEKKRAPIRAATLTGAVETGTPAKMATTSTAKHTTSVAERQPFRIADLLHPGAKNATPRRQLMALTGLSDRDLRLMIEAERRRGIPILSDNQRGYWLSYDPAEIKKFSRSMKRRAAEIRLTAMHVERALENGETN